MNNASITLVIISPTISSITTFVTIVIISITTMLLRRGRAPGGRDLFLLYCRGRWTGPFISRRLPNLNHKTGIHPGGEGA